MRERDGFVLIAVIFITGLLAITTTAFVANVRSNTLFARAMIYNHQLEAAADGMAHFTAFQLATRDVTKPLQAEWQCTWNEDVSVAIKVQDQGGLVDINTANPELLEALVRGLGKADAEAKTIVGAIADYKDPDTITSSGMTEASTYPAQSAGPSDGPFATIEELDRVPAIDDKLFKVLLPLVTVHSQQQGFDRAAAAPTLIKTLNAAGISDTQLSRYASPTPARVYALTIAAKRKASGIFTRKEIISLTGQPDRPFAILKWTTASDDSKMFESRAQGAACVSLM